MKKAILLIFALLITTSSFSQGVLNLFGKSEDFFKLLSEEKFTEAYGYFDPTFQGKVSEDNIKKLWAKITEDYGKMESVEVVSSKTQGDFFSVSIEGKFAKQTQGFLLGFNKSEKIVGIFLEPKSATAAYVKPAYADTTLYKESEVHIVTPGHDLVGILTAPKKAANFPIVVLVHGSGPQDMDETYGPNKPFKDLAAGLAAKGIATIRYVKRTLIYPREFTGSSATVKQEILDDATAAIALARTLPGVNKKQIYVLGHSLGGMVAPRLATPAPDLNGVILLGAPARKFTDLIVEQSRYMFSLGKDTTQAAKMKLDSGIKELDITRITKLGNIKPDSSLFGMSAAYWVDINLYNQVEVAKKAKQRFFVAQGENDIQVSATDYGIWNGALGKKKTNTLKLYPGLNNMFIPQTEKGDLKQYQVPGNVSDVLINDIAAWIKAK